MVTLDEDFLRDVGLETLPSDEKALMLAHVLETVQKRVGLAIAASLTSKQLGEFEEILDEADDESARIWLQTHCHRHSEIVTHHFEAVRKELRASAAEILAAAAEGVPRVTTRLLNGTSKGTVQA